MNLKSFIIRSIANTPGRVLLSFNVLLLAAVLVTGLLKFERDIFKLLPADNPTFQVLVHAMKRSTAQDRLFLLVTLRVEGKTLIDSAKRLTDALRKMTVDNVPAFEKITYQKAEAVGSEEFKTIYDRFLEDPKIFLTEEDQEKFSHLITSEEALERELQKSLAIIAMPGAADLARMAAMDPFNFRQFILEKLQRLHQGFVFAAGPNLLSADGRALLIIATPAKALMEPDAARRLLAQVERIRSAVPELEIGMTGGYAIAAQEEALVRGDIAGCLIGSMIGITVFLIIVYRNFFVLSFFMIPLVAGIQLAMGVMAVLCDAIHMLAMAFAAVIIGLGIDFAIHIYDRYISERQKGQTIEAALERTVFQTGGAVLVGGLTTLAVFLVITFGDTPILFQIGWLVVLGLFFCMLNMLWALPAWLVWIERYTVKWLHTPAHRLGMESLGRWVNGHAKTALLLTGVLFAAALPGLRYLAFEQDPMALKPQKLEAVTVQEAMLRAFGQGDESVLVAWKADDGNDYWEKCRILDRTVAALQATGAVSSWVSLGRLASASFSPPPNVNLQRMTALLKQYGFSPDSVHHLSAFLEKRFKSDHRLVPPRMENPLDAYPDIYHPFYFQAEDQLQGIAVAHVADPKAVTVLKDHLSTLSFDVIVVNPRSALGELVSAGRQRLFFSIGLAGVLIIGIIWIYFRKGSTVLLVLVPVFLGLLTTAGIMGWTGTHLNFFNFIVLPLLLGIGIDDGVHIVGRYRESRKVETTLATSGRSVLVTTITTIGGFGSLYLADYHILESMGLFAAVGVTVCFLFSALTLPALLKRMNPRL
ncbi:MAG: MMPL family transporter [Desulfobacterales bacterium]|jgi:predicted RND superfamily exporter protein|nr:MMPL family transporter [Desulfobacterales bacterium]